METKLQHSIWHIELPEQLVAEAGFSDGEHLECRAFPGELSILSKDASEVRTAGALSRAEKKFAAGAKAFLLWFFSIFAGQRGFTPKKRKGQGTSCPAGL